MKYFKFRCLDCGHELIENKDGLNCPECKGPVTPIGEASPEEILQLRQQAKYNKQQGMNYKEVLEGQIKTLQVMQEDVVKISGINKADVSIRLAEEIRLLCEDARRIR